MKRLAVLLIGLGTLTMGTGCFFGGRCNPCSCGYGGSPSFGTQYAPVPTGSLTSPYVTTQAAYPVADASIAPMAAAAVPAPFGGVPVTAMGPTESLPTY
jgi:hypothetical protein